MVQGLTSAGFLLEAGVWTLPIAALVAMNETWTDTTSNTARQRGTTGGAATGSRHRGGQRSSGR